MSPSEREQREKLSKVTLKDIEIDRKTFSTVKALPASQGLSESDLWFIQCVPEMLSHVADVLMSDETLCMLHRHKSLPDRQTRRLLDLIGPGIVSLQTMHPLSGLTAKMEW